MEAMAAGLAKSEQHATQMKTVLQKFLLENRLDKPERPAAYPGR